MPAEKVAQPENMWPEVRWKVWLHGGGMGDADPYFENAVRAYEGRYDR